MGQFLEALTPLDGRYHKATKELGDIFSEYGLIKSRVYVEIQWFKFLADELKLFQLSTEDWSKVEAIYTGFTPTDGEEVKNIEATTNHDVKAVEYFLKRQLVSAGLGAFQEWVHFSCTSADINNTSYSLMIRRGRECLLAHFKDVLTRCEELAKLYKTIPMMSRTHGQPATPTTVGKEFINFAWRIRREINVLKALPIEAKLNGATGSFNAHHFTFPTISWPEASRKFLEDYLKVSPLMFTTQINPNHYISEIFHCLIRLSSTLIDLDRDMWGYISLGYFKQKLREGEVGSSTMPHKVNPIDFENSEGNLGIAISLLQHLSTKLLNSRFQRDLTDSTVMRNIGVVFGYILLSLKSTLKGLDKIELNAERTLKDLNDNWELLAEPVQTVMRVYGEENPYEKLKALTRGVKISQKELAEFTDQLTRVPDEVKEKMKAL
ncbi:MAG: adenylosuccinate lyase, partial [Candidatus Omnitrophica bacterium]|nr:adenylosuccinate lyase [Candidatus Omnitrophota bacterium]